MHSDPRCLEFGSTTVTAPHYTWISKQFNERLALFELFVEQKFAAKVAAKQFELTYINHVSDDSGWRTVEDLASVLPDMSWRTQPRFLPMPEGVNFSAVFKLPATAGRLHLRAQSAQRRPDGKPVLVLELTARGFLPDRTEWFDLAHDWIVRAFSDLTGQEVQSQTWRRTQ